VDLEITMVLFPLMFLSAFIVATVSENPYKLTINQLLVIQLVESNK
jgi:hypothetical protein